VAEEDARRRGEDAGALAAGYERLRAAVLSGSAGGWRLGHGLLSARGTVAWMRAVGAAAPPAAAGMDVTGAGPRSSAECREPPTGRPESLPDADQVVAVLTQMVLPLAA
jgi:hypothetical protein